MGDLLATIVYLKSVYQIKKSLVNYNSTVWIGLNYKCFLHLNSSQIIKVFWQNTKYVWNNISNACCIQISFYLWMFSIGRTLCSYKWLRSIGINKGLCIWRILIKLRFHQFLFVYHWHASFYPFCLLII